MKLTDLGLFFETRRTRLQLPMLPASKHNRSKVRISIRNKSAFTTEAEQSRLLERLAYAARRIT